MKVKWWIQTDKIGSKCQDVAEFDDEEWASMSDSEREDTMKDITFECMDWGYEEQS